MCHEREACFAWDLFFKIVAAVCLLAGISFMVSSMVMGSDAGNLYRDFRIVAFVLMPTGTACLIFVCSTTEPAVEHILRQRRVAADFGT